MKLEFKKRKNYLSFAPPLIEAEEEQAVLETLRSGWLTAGPKVDRFQKRVAEYIGVKHAVAVNSCTAALHLSLLASGIGSGDEVLVPTFTFASTAHAVVYVGAKPVFLDIDPATLNLDVTALESKITPKTRAVIPVHYGGLPCPLNEIYALAKKYNFQVIEDAAHAIGAMYDGGKIGSFGPLTCFSFYATKNMTTGEGGMVVTEDGDVAGRIQVLSMYGINDARQMANRYGANGSWFYDVGELGYKYNMTDIDAAIGLQQLVKLDGFIRRRTEIAARYQEAFSEIREIQIPFWPTESGTRHAWHVYPVQLKPESLSISRNAFMEELRACNIGTSVLFRPLHLHSYYQKTFGYREGDFPSAESAFENLIALPIYPKMTDQDVSDVIYVFQDLIQRFRRNLA